MSRKKVQVKSENDINYNIASDCGSDLISDQTSFSSADPLSEQTSKALPDPTISAMQPVSIQDAAQAAAELQAFKTLTTRNSRKKRSRAIRIACVSVAIMLAAVGVAAILRFVVFPEQVSTRALAADTITYGTFSDAISGTGTLEANESVAVTADVDGTVAELNVAEGDMVTEGQVLFVVNSPEVENQLRAAERALEAAKLGVRNATIARDEAVQASARAYQAWQSSTTQATQAAQTTQAAMPIKKAQTTQTADAVQTMQTTQATPISDEAAARQQIDAAYAQYESSRSQVSSAQQQVESTALQLADAQAALEAAKKADEKRTVKSSIAGQVVSMNIERGMKLSALTSSGKSPLRIADLSKMRMTLNINEVDILKIKVDQNADVRFDALGGYVAKARVQRISATSGNDGAAALGQASSSGASGRIVTFPVELVIDNPDPRLKIGMTAQASISANELTNVHMVNSLALGNYDEEVNEATLTLLREDGQTEEVTVKVLAKSDNLAAIEGSIKEGDQALIVAGVAMTDAGIGSEDAMSGATSGAVSGNIVYTEDGNMGGIR
ncbi:MAG: efflux RND transporter periplasmic adaptor subunit [Coriobacteriales bacterium]|jgi:HlyD family secretion protein|nr:efflux RND transporter periplasmic adaptor subunit [Coriobacteriales bacterium]